MSYCRFSSDSGYSDAYVYESQHGWITHIADMKYPEGAPLFGIDASSLARKWGVEDVSLLDVIYRNANKIRDKWSAENHMVEIKHKEAGARYDHATPKECADNLVRLKNEGFNIPQYAIDALNEEARENNHE